MQRPKTFADLIRRFVPDLPDDAYPICPLAATALEMDATLVGKQKAFWVVVHSVTDRGVKLLHAKPVRGSCLSLRIQVEGGEVVQAMLAVAGSRSQGPLYETQAEFEHAGLGASKL